MVSRPTCQEYGALQLETDRALVLGTFLDLTLYTSSSVHLYYHTLYNKLINISKHFPQFCELS